MNDDNIEAMNQLNQHIDEVYERDLDISDLGIKHKTIRHDKARGNKKHRIVRTIGMYFMVVGNSFFFMNGLNLINNITLLSGIMFTVGQVGFIVYLLGID